MQPSPQGEISVVPVSHRDNSGVCSTVQQITELRQTVGCVYQYQRRSLRLHFNASLTLHLYMAGFGHWPTNFFSFIRSSHPHSLHFTCSPPSSFPFFFFFFFSYLPLLLPSPAFSLPSFFPNSSSFCYMSWCTNHSLYVCVCVCQAYPSRLIYYAVGETKVQEMEVRTHR